MEQNYTFNNQDVLYKSTKGLDYSEQEGEVIQKTIRPSVACVHRILSFAHAYQGLKSKKFGTLSLLLN